MDVMADNLDQIQNLSISGKKWILRDYSKEQVENYRQRLGVSEVLAAILCSKNIAIDEVESFLQPTIKDLLLDPFHIKDMKRGVDRIVNAIIKKEKIAIFGDYDVDGATSTSIFVRYLKNLGVEVEFYIPDRIKEGYGPNINALRELSSRGNQLIIIVDCGTSAHETLEKITEEGVDVIVVDHHQGQEVLPKIYALINPNRFDEETPYKYLAAVGVSFVVLVGVNSALRKLNYFSDNNVIEPNLLQLLDLVALGTVCDVVPLVGLNRAIVTQGLKILSSWKKPGLSVLAELLKIQGQNLSTYHLGYMIGPRINAGGRVGCADLGSRLLCTDDENQARSIASSLEEFNTERKDIEYLAFQEAVLQYEAKKKNNNAIIVYSNSWHEGIIGIVAGRLKEKYGLPAIVITFDGERGKGSCRSVKGFNIGEIIVEAMNAGLVMQGGGHAMAAGLTMQIAMINDFEKFIQEKFIESSTCISDLNVSYYETRLKLSEVNIYRAKEIEKIAPFGAGNFEPRFLLKNVIIKKVQVFGEIHMRVLLADSENNIENVISAVAFRVVGHPIFDYLTNYSIDKVSVIGFLRINSWRGQEKADFIIEDILVD